MESRVQWRTSGAVAEEAALSGGPFGLALLDAVDEPEEHRERRFELLLKTALDRTVAFLLIVGVLPAMLLIALAIKLTSPGPVLFRQDRVGRDGRIFTFYKFRTMVVDAEDRLAELLDANDGDGILFKMRSDPRVTSVGRFLRRLSLDELPQLVHVLTGDMSLVGPRPPLPKEVAQYDAHTFGRLAVKPGLTGLWQVSGRSDLTWAESVRLDLEYVERWSLGLDVRILVRTIPAVLLGRGAY